jgi:hypothetical protein
MRRKRVITARTIEETMTHLIGIAVVFALGFGAGRVHHLSGLKTKVLSLETKLKLEGSVVSADAKKVLAEVKTLLHIK